MFVIDREKNIVSIYQDLSSDPQIKRMPVLKEREESMKKLIFLNTSKLS